MRIKSDELGYGNKELRATANATGNEAVAKAALASAWVRAPRGVLDRRQAFHYETLSEHLCASDPAVAQRVEAMTHAMTASGIDVVQAHDRAIALLAGSMRVQASVLGFNDTFFVSPRARRRWRLAVTE